jgi:hypothetical protein
MSAPVTCSRFTRASSFPPTSNLHAFHVSSFMEFSDFCFLAARNKPVQSDPHLNPLRGIIVASFSEPLKAPFNCSSKSVSLQLSPRFCRT